MYFVVLILSAAHLFRSVLSEDSPAKVANSMGKNGGTTVCILPCDQSKLPRKDVKIIETLVYTAMDVSFYLRFSQQLSLILTSQGKDANFATWQVKAGPKDREHHVGWLKHATKLFAAGHFKTLPTENLGGLDEVESGLQKMRAGKVRAQKLVYTV